MLFRSQLRLEGCAEHGTDFVLGSDVSKLSCEDEEYKFPSDERHTSLCGRSATCTEAAASPAFGFFTSPDCSCTGDAIPNHQSQDPALAPFYTAEDEGCRNPLVVDHLREHADEVLLQLYSLPVRGTPQR